METTGNNTNHDDLGDSKWNNLQKKTHSNEEYNEGFSSENIPDYYDPSQENRENQMRVEYEIDEEGSEIEVRRARFVDKDSPEGSVIEDPQADNEIIENRQSVRNRDYNYDVESDRYPVSHPDNYHNRGNIETDQP